MADYAQKKSNRKISTLEFFSVMSVTFDIVTRGRHLPDWSLEITCFLSSSLTKTKISYGCQSLPGIRGHVHNHECNQSDFGAVIWGILMNAL